MGIGTRQMIETALVVDHDDAAGLCRALHVFGLAAECADASVSENDVLGSDEVGIGERTTCIAWLGKDEAFAAEGRLDAKVCAEKLRGEGWGESK